MAKGGEAHAVLLLPEHRIASYTKIIFTNKRHGNMTQVSHDALEDGMGTAEDLDKYRAPALDKGLDILELLAGTNVCALAHVFGNHDLILRRDFRQSHSFSLLQVVSAS